MPSIQIVENSTMLNMRHMDPGCIQINSGTMSARFLKDSPITYSSNAYVPKQDWRSLTSLEWDILRSKESCPDHLSVGVIRIPEDHFSCFYKLGLAQIKTLEDTQTLITDPGYPTALATLLQTISPHVLSFDPNTALNLGYGISGLYTSTKRNIDTLLGLHLDHWDKQPLYERKNSQNRLCINMGQSPRFFQFINLSVEAIFELCQKKGLMDVQDVDDLHLLVSLFLENFSNYPVVRIKLQPGEAYIAPTENCIHDGSTLGQPYCDLQLTIRGRISL